jgi:Pyridoxamine 5'-phosphate oxidase
MSIRTAPDLRAIVSERPNAYVVTVSADGTPHTVYAPVQWERGTLVAEVGATSAANAAARPRLSLLYPVRADGDYSLIVDGAAVGESGGGLHRVRVTPSKAVLHRPGAPQDPASSCGADCVPLPLPVAVSITR